MNDNSLLKLSIFINRYKSLLLIIAFINNICIWSVIHYCFHLSFACNKVALTFTKDKKEDPKPKARSFDGIDEYTN